MPICSRGARALALASTVAAALPWSCSSGDPLVLGRKPALDGGSPGRAGGGSSFDNAGAASPVGGNASSPSASSLRVQIEREAVAVEIVTVQCARDCVAVEAVARGGFPPYSYRWEDGSTSPARTLCPNASARFTVTATDSGVDGAEFRQKPSTAQSTVSAEVFDCSDAGMQADAGALDPDGGAPSPDGGAPQCASAPTAEAGCTSLALATCDDRLVAELPEPIARGGSRCFVFTLGEPLGGTHWASMYLATGADACASDDPLGAFMAGEPFQARPWKDELCVAAAGTPIERVSMTESVDFFGQPYPATLMVCDACPR